MKRIPFIKENFPGMPKEARYLGYTTTALIRAVVTAGQKLPQRRRTTAGRADTGMRINALKSAVNMTGSSLIPTREFLAAGSTDRAHKSYFIGNTLCAHAAYSELSIPWLVDIERLGTEYEVIPSLRGKRRPDFLGRDPRNRWYVFESKGRSVRPTKPMLLDWKLQAKAISQVNGIAVSNNIVSAAYLSKALQWELLWVDPPVKPKDTRIAFDEISFFKAYYAPLVALIESGSVRTTGPYGPLNYIVSLGAYLGLHPTVLRALRSRETSAILAFALERMEAKVVAPEDETEVSVFADGLIVKLGPYRDREHESSLPHLPPST